MKIVVLDGFTLNPGDLEWARLARLGDLKVYERTTRDQILERIEEAEAVFTNKTPLDRELLSRISRLKYIGVLATGYNVVDVDAAAQRGITVTNVPAYSTNSVAQLVFALLLELCQHVQQHSDAVHAGDWVASKDFSFTRTPLTELAGKTLGILGFGRIGQKVAAIASAFGMQVRVFSRTQKNISGSAGGGDVRWCDLEELFSDSDVVTLHCPLTPETAGLVDREKLAWMKPSAFLINTSRGPLVNEADLAEALHQGRIAGAGLDVLSAEPPQADNPLLTAPNCIITPHIAWATREARVRLMEVAVSNLERFLAGDPVNVVTFATSYCSEK
ncbi:MAG TPA: glycerate dehydrogenase [Clostridiales bacterium]|nr:glycerate dehydrogenase [Clostridiales bacterium]